MKNTLNLSEKMNPFFSLEIKKCKDKTSCIVFGVLLIFEYSSERIELHTHAGKIILKGTRLDLNVFKDGGVEIYGRMEGICFV